MSEIICSDMDFFNDSSIQTHTKIEQVRKQWDVIFESLAKGEKSLAFIFPYDDFHNTWNTEYVYKLTFESIIDNMNDRFCALIRITTYLNEEKED